MSISTALLVAQSGLRSTELRSSLVSSNIANAGTDGYVRRDALQVSLGTLETGRSVDVRVLRNVDERLVTLSRGASSDLSEATTRGALLQAHLTGLGDPGDQISPAARLARFQSGLDLLRNAPGDAAIQADVLSRADSLVSTIRSGAESLVRTEEAARQTISTGIARVNEVLGRLAALNAQIAPGSSASMSPDIQDQIGRELQALSEEMDIRASTDASGRVVVQTSLGAELLRGRDHAELRYDGTRILADEVEITPGVDGVRGFVSGAIGGAVKLIAEDIPKMQSQYDELARGLVEAFEQADASLAAGDAGLFTDEGRPFDPVRTDGLALRLAVNDAVRPAAGGALWRLRDGIGATGPGDPGDATQVEAFVAAMDAPRGFSASAGLGASMSLGTFAADLVGAQQLVGVATDDTVSRRTVALRAFQDARGEVEGVNVDEELQKLLEIEQSYGANAKVLTTLTEMIDTLLAAV